MTNDDIINEVLKYESSGYVNLPNDKGGPTRYGITAHTLGAYRKLGHDASPDDVQNLTRAEAIDIYASQYITAPKFDLIKNDQIRWIMVDSGVVHGPINPVNWLQSILGVKMDGIIGPNTLGVLDSKNQAFIFASLCAARIESISRLVRRDPTQMTFLVGWITRVNSILTRGITGLFHG